MKKGTRRRAPRTAFKKGSPETLELSRRANEAKAKRRAANPETYSYRPVKQLFTKLLAEQDPAKREESLTHAESLARDILRLAHEGEQWAAHLIYERIEGRVPNVIRTDSRRRYEELTPEELARSLADRLS